MSSSKCIYNEIVGCWVREKIEDYKEIFEKLDLSGPISCSAFRDLSINRNYFFDYIHVSIIYEAETEETIRSRSFSFQSSFIYDLEKAKYFVVEMSGRCINSILSELVNNKS